ncbi:MAG: cohesin domain-containing protein, partial [bacterium]|nr:cohesin domain-containing protein [bacterium]
GALGDLYRGMWIVAQSPTIGTRNLTGILTADTVIQLPDGSRVPRAQLDWGAQAEVSGFVARDEFLIRDITFSNVIRSFELTTTLAEFKAEHQWMSFEPGAPYRAAREIAVTDHFGDPITLPLLSELLGQLDLQLRLSFTRDNDGSRLVSKIESFRPDAEVTHDANQEVLRGAHIRAWDTPALIFPQGIDNAHFNRELEVYDTFGSRVDPRVLAPAIPVRAYGLILSEHYQGQTQRITRVHRIDILGSERITYRGTLLNTENGQLSFREPEAFLVASHTDIREETGLQTDFVTLSGRIRSEGGLRLHVGADFNTSGSPQLYWVRILRTGESEPSFSSEQERVATFIAADETRRTITPRALAPVQLTPDTRILNLSGDPVAQTSLVTDARVSVQTELRGGQLVAIEVRVETQPQTFSLTGDIEHIDREARVIYFDTPREIRLADPVGLFSFDGTAIGLSDLVAQLRASDTHLLRVTYTPDSSDEAPVASKLETVSLDRDTPLSANQVFIVVEDPGGQINTHDRRIHPMPLPPMVVARDAKITDAAGQVLSLDGLSERVRIHFTGHDTGGRLVLSAIDVLGPRLESGKGTIASIDVTTRILTPAPEPSQTIDRRGSFSDASGQHVTLTQFAESVTQNPNMVLAVYFDPFGSTIQSMRLLNERDVSPQSGVALHRANEVVVDAANALLAFAAIPPVRVAEGAPVTGPNGETWDLTNLQAGQRIFVRGYSLSDGNFVITAIFVRTQINSLHLRPEIVAADGDGIENDVRIAIVDQNETVVTEAMRLQVDYNGPEEIGTGHIVRNLSPGPHLLSVDLPARIGFADRARVFISAQGSAFRVTRISPEANATNVATLTDISVSFNEPIHQVGDYIALEGTLIPDSDGDGSEPEVHDDGHTLVFRNVKLVPKTDYTIVLFSATGESGNSLGHTYRSRFSTGGTLTQPGSLSGLLALSETVRFVGTAHLFDSRNEPVSEVALGESGSFSFADLNAGSYRLYLDIHTEDGRSTSAFVDADNNGEPDNITLSQGENRNNLTFSLTLPAVTDPGTNGSNGQVVVALDLDGREGNQNQTRAEELQNSDVRVAVYARGVVDLIGYEMTLNYDSEKLAFQGVEDQNGSERSLLRQNGGLVVALPPGVSRNRISFAGGILGATSAQAVSGDGLLGVFRFRVRNENFTGTAVRLPRVVFQGRTAIDVVTPGAAAEIVPATSRLVMRLKTAPGEKPINGYFTSLVHAEIVDALGAKVTDGIPVRFHVQSGGGKFTQEEVLTRNGLATSELTGKGVQAVTVTAGSVTEELKIELVAFSGSDPTPQQVGQIVLDMDTQSGDQGQRSISAPNVGDTFAIDVVATRDALGMAGYQVVLKYDPAHLSFEGFKVSGIFTGASPITIPGTGLVDINAAFLGSGPTREGSGSIGQATFKVAEGFKAPSAVALTSAILSTGSTQKTVTLGVGTEVIIGVDPVSTDRSADFDGDGEVGFTDFIQFAQAFGARDGEAKYNAQMDLDSSGDIGFTDFIQFAGAFGKPIGSATAASKVVGQNINRRAQVHLGSRTTDAGDEIELTVGLSDVGGVLGYGLEIHYDPAALAFVGGSNSHPSKFAAGMEIALIAEPGSGTLLVSDVLQSTLSASADLAHLRFRVLDPTVSTRVEIAGALIADPAGQITALGGQQANVRALPTGYALNQNHPNPFNPDTIVPFSLPQSGEIHLAIYNALGQEIRLLASGVREAGFHRIAWDGKDQSGRLLASGIYFARLKAGSYHSVRKMLLIK